MRAVKIAIGVFLILGGINALALQRIDRNLEKFQAGCTRRCEEPSGNPLCSRYCSCLLDELKAQFPSKRELAAHLSAASERVRANGSVMDEPEFQALAQRCVERVRR